MIAIWRFPIILALSVLFGLPALQRLMMQPQSLLRAGLQYLGALTLAWLGVNVVFGVMEHYAQHNRRVEEKEETERIAAELFEQQRIQREAAEEQLAADRKLMAEELAEQASRPGSSAGSDSGQTSGPMPLGQPVSLDMGPAAAPAPADEPTTATIAQDLLREEAGAGVI